MQELKIGLTGQTTVQVTEDKLAVNVGSGDVLVFATPMMIAGMEGTAAGSVKQYLEDGKTTVGMELNVSHVAATPVGMNVRFESELTDISGKVLTFRLAAHDEAGLIGEGTHKRAIVDKVRFEERAAAKKG